MELGGLPCQPQPERSRRVHKEECSALVSSLTVCHPGGGLDHLAPGDLHAVVAFGDGLAVFYELEDLKGDVAAQEDMSFPTVYHPGGGLDHLAPGDLHAVVAFGDGLAVFYELEDLKGDVADDEVQSTSRHFLVGPPPQKPGRQKIEG